MTIAIIASNSFSGSALVDYLLSKTDDKILGFNRSPEYPAVMLPYLHRRERPGRFSFYHLDLNTKLPEIMEVLDREKPRYVINFAAQGEVGQSWNYPVKWFQTNAVGVVGIMDALSGRDYLERFVQISTPEVYGSCNHQKEDPTLFNPSSPYAASKGSADLFCTCLHKVKQFPSITIRSTNVYGAHQQLYRIIPRTVIYRKLEKIIELHGGGQAVKSYLHIRDVCHGIYLAMTKGIAGGLYHFGPEGGGISIRNLVGLVCSALGQSFDSATRSIGERTGQDQAYILDWTKAKRELGWSPTVSLEEGIGEMISWIHEGWGDISKLPHDYIVRD